MCDCRILEKEGLYPQFMDFDRICFYDNYTDSLITSTVYLQPDWLSLLWEAGVWTMLNFAMIAAIPLVWIGILYNHTYHGFDILPICMSSFVFTSAFAAQLHMEEE